MELRGCAVVVLWICCLLIAPRRAFAAREVRCIDAGACQLCQKDELAEDYCQEYARKMRVTCTYGVDKEKFDYRPCPLTAEDEQNRVIIFQLLMGLLGGLAYYGVQQRKQRSATPFESRKSKFAARQEY